MGRNGWGTVALFLLAMAGLLLFLNWMYPGVLSQDDAQMRIVHGVLVMVLVGSSLIVTYRQRMGLALQQALIWVAIGLALVTVYSYRGEFAMLANRVGGELTPSQPLEVAYGRVSLTASNDGHYWADATVNGTHVRFLLDTGATSVALARHDARRLGLRLNELSYTIPIRTAGGDTFAAPVLLDEVTVGSIAVRNVRAIVARDDSLDRSLLGMTFLSRLSGFEVSGNQLILEQ